MDVLAQDLQIKPLLEAASDADLLKGIKALKHADGPSKNLSVKVSDISVLRSVFTRVQQARNMCQSCACTICLWGILGDGDGVGTQLS